MIDQNEIKEMYSISAIRDKVSDILRIDDTNRGLAVGKTQTKIITDADDFDVLEKDWNELVWDSNAHIFQTFEWNRIWWKHFGNSKKLHIFAVYNNNRLIGIAPLFEDNVSLLGRNVYSSLRFLGSYVTQPEGKPLIGTIPYSDYLDCIIHPGFENQFYELILQHFEEVKTHFDEIILDEVPEESTIQNTMIPLITENNYELSYQKEKASSSPVIQLDSTWDAYLDSLNVKDRYNARRYYKRSKQGKSMVFKIEKLKHSKELPRVQTDFMRLHQQQWNNRGFAGTFSEQRMRDFFMEISKTLYEKDWLEFNMAVPPEGDIKYAAIDVIMTYKNRLYLMHRGMDEDPLYRKQGPGNVLLFARLKEAINDGVNVFDMLRGSEEFKLRMATKINQNKRIIVRSEFSLRRFLSELVKKTMRIIHQFRSEKSHIKLLFKNKPMLTGVSDYIQFLQRRIKYKFFK